MALLFKIKTCSLKSQTCNTFRPIFNLDLWHFVGHVVINVVKIETCQPTYQPCCQQDRLAIKTNNTKLKSVFNINMLSTILDGIQYQNIKKWLYPLATRAITTCWPFCPPSLMAATTKIYKNCYYGQRIQDRNLQLKLVAPTRFGQSSTWTHCWTVLGGSHYHEAQKWLPWLYY